MDKQLKDNLDKALTSGKDALANLKEITKRITKEMVEKSKTQGQDVKVSANNLFKEILVALQDLGKNTFEYLKAAGSGFVEGLKESSHEDNNLLKALGTSVLGGLKHLGAAGVFVTKESAKNLAGVIEGFFKKEKDEKKSKKDSG